MIPSNSVLQVGVIQKYNNNIVIGDNSTEIGESEDIIFLDSAAAANPGDSAEAEKPLDSAVLWFLILKSRYVALDSVDNRNDCKKWLVDLTIVSVWYSSV